MAQLRAFTFAFLGYMLGIFLFEAFGPHPQMIPLVDEVATTDPLETASRTPASQGTSPAQKPLLVTSYELSFLEPHDDFANLNHPMAWPFDPPTQKNYLEPTVWEKNIFDLNQIGIRGLFLALFSHSKDPSEVWSHSQAGLWYITRAIRRTQAKIQVAPQIQFYGTNESLFDSVYEQQIKPFFAFIVNDYWLISQDKRPFIYFTKLPPIEPAIIEKLLSQIRTQFKQDFYVEPILLTDSTELARKIHFDGVLPQPSIKAGLVHHEASPFHVDTVSIPALDQLTHPWTCHSENKNHPGFNAKDSTPTVSPKLIQEFQTTGFASFFEGIHSNADFVFIQGANNLIEGRMWLRAVNYPRPDNPVANYCAPTYILGQDLRLISQKHALADDGRYLPEDFYLRNLESVIFKHFGQCNPSTSSFNDSASPEGFVDTVNCAQIAGWARDADTAKSTLIDVTIDNSIKLATRAEGFRSDLPFLDKNHGFTLSLPFMNDGKVHKIEVRAINADQSHRCSLKRNNTLILSKELICKSMQDAHPPAGALEDSGCKGFKGWARDPDSPFSTRIVIKDKSGRTLYSGKTDVSRFDIPFPDKNHGFNISNQFLIDGQKHTVDIFAENLDAFGKPGGNHPNTLLGTKTLICPSR